MNKIKLYLYGTMIVMVLALAVTNYFNTKKAQKYKGEYTLANEAVKELARTNLEQSKQIKDLIDENERLAKKLNRRNK